MILGPAPKPKPVHRASKISNDGNVSALCFKRPRPIVLTQASWTNRDEAVTCKKCLRAMREIANAPEGSP